MFIAKKKIFWWITVFSIILSFVCQDFCLARRRKESMSEKIERLMHLCRTYRDKNLRYTKARQRFLENLENEINDRLKEIGYFLLLAKDRFFVYLTWKEFFKFLGIYKTFYPRKCRRIKKSCMNRRIIKTELDDEIIWEIIYVDIFKIPPAELRRFLPEETTEKNSKGPKKRRRDDEFSEDELSEDEIYISLEKELVDVGVQVNMDKGESDLRQKKQDKWWCSYSLFWVDCLWNGLFGNPEILKKAREVPGSFWQKAGVIFTNGYGLEN